jgi:alpha-tubulin suppressor-like RCC1 family protein
VTTGEVAYCWGSNGFGELGDGTTTSHPTPVAVAGGLPFLQVSAGFRHTCGTTTSRAAYCWGIGGEGSLGDGTGNPSLIPVAVAGGLQFGMVRAGWFHSCGVTLASVAYCWGSGVLGDGTTGGGTTFQQLAPVAVAGGLAFRWVSTGAYNTCGVTTENRGFCWGPNVSGELGDGTRTQRLTPVPVAGPI